MIASKHPVSAVSPDRWHRLLELTVATRRLQQSYRRTIDSRIRRRMEDSEVILDSLLGEITEQLAATAVEGGAA